MSASFDLGLLLLSLSLVMLILIFTLSDYFLLVPIFSVLSFAASLALLKGEEIVLKRKEGLIVCGLEWMAALYWAWFLAFTLLFAFSLFYGGELRSLLDNMLSVFLVSGLAGFAATLKLDKFIESVWSPRSMLWSDVVPEDSFTLQFSHRFLALAFSFAAVFAPLGAMLWGLSLLGVLLPLHLLLGVFSVAAAVLTIFLFKKDKVERLEMGMGKIYLFDLLHDSVSSEMRVDLVKTVKLRRIAEMEEYFIEVTDVDGWRFASKLKDVKGFQRACGENRLKIS